MFVKLFSPKILNTCWLQAPYAFSRWGFEFKLPFSCGNDGGGKFLKKTQGVSRNWLQKNTPSQCYPQ
jgi:hypothetical protein